MFVPFMAVMPLKRCRIESGNRTRYSTCFSSGSGTGGAQYRPHHYGTPVDPHRYVKRHATIHVVGVFNHIYHIKHKYEVKLSALAKVSQPRAGSSTCLFPGCFPVKSCQFNPCRRSRETGVC